MKIKNRILEILLFQIFFVLPLVANNNIEKGNNNNNNSGNRNEAEILIDVASSMVVSSPGESLKLSQKALNIA
ncbi:MAG: hypothetical protein ABSG15_03420, partial [FCB group bacterium]